LPERFERVRLKKQSQFVPELEPVQTIPKACGFEAATRPLWLRVSLKKQSQFFKDQNDVTPIITMCYGVLGGPGRRENKANPNATVDQ